MKLPNSWLKLTLNLDYLSTTLLFLTISGHGHGSHWQPICTHIENWHLLTSCEPFLSLKHLTLHYDLIYWQLEKLNINTILKQKTERRRINTCICLVCLFFQRHTVFCVIILTLLSSLFFCLSCNAQIQYKDLNVFIPTVRSDGYKCFLCNLYSLGQHQQNIFCYYSLLSIGLHRHVYNNFILNVAHCFLHAKIDDGKTQKKNYSLTFDQFKAHTDDAVTLTV